MGPNITEKYYEKSQGANPEECEGIKRLFVRSINPGTQLQSYREGNTLKKHLFLLGNATYKRDAYA